MKIIKKIKVDLGDRSYPIIIGNGIYGNKNLYKNSNPKNSILVINKMELGVDNIAEEIKNYDPILISINKEKFMTFFYVF